MTENNEPGAAGPAEKVKMEEQTDREFLTQTDRSIQGRTEETLLVSDTQARIDVVRAFRDKVLPDISAANYDRFERWVLEGDYLDLLTENTVVTERGADFAGAFTGGPSEAMLAALMALNEGETVHALMQDRIVPTLELWERDGIGTAEDHVDLMLQVLMRSDVRPDCSAQFLGFAARVRSFLVSDRQPEDSRGTGWLTSWGALADFISRGSAKPCIEQGAYYYHEVLSFLCARPDLAEEDPRLVRIQAGNLASRMIRIAGQDLAAENAEIGETINRVHRLVALATPTPDGGDAEGVARLLRVLLGFGAPIPIDAARSHASRLVAMTGAISAWRHLWFADKTGDTTKWAMTHGSYLAMAGGLAGALILEPDDYDDVPQGLFNAGVDVMKATRRTEAVSRDLSEWLRALLSGAGLWWALRLTGNLETALDEFHGSDCAVNLFGALTDLHRQLGDANPDRPDTRLARLLAGSQLPPDDRYRLGNSWRELYGEPPDPEPRPDITTLRSAVHEVMSVLANIGKISWPEDLPGVFDAARDAPVVHAMAEIFIKAMDSWLGRKERERIGRDIANVVAVLDKEAQDLRAALTTIYGDMAGSPLKGESGTGPLVASGIMTEDEWKDLADRSVGEFQPLSRILEENLDWL